MTERRRTVRRTTPRTDPNADAIGPRRVGGTYHSHYGNYTYRVTGLHRTVPGSPHGWLLEAVILDGPNKGETRTHCTAWDPDRDQVITEPAGGGQ